MKYANHLKRTEVSHLSLFCGVFIVSSLVILVMGKDAVLQSEVFDCNALSLFRLQGTDKVEMLI